MSHPNQKHSYTSLTGYGRVSLDEKTLNQWRSGHSPANPFEAQMLVKRIDELTGAIDRLMAPHYRTDPYEPPEPPTE